MKYSTDGTNLFIEVEGEENGVKYSAKSGGEGIKTKTLSSKEAEQFLVDRKDTEDKLAQEQMDSLVIENNKNVEELSKVLSSTIGKEGTELLYKVVGIQNVVKGSK